VRESLDSHGSHCPAMRAPCTPVNKQTRLDGPPAQASDDDGADDDLAA
jgi:hypothetical protein